MNHNIVRGCRSMAQLGNTRLEQLPVILLRDTGNAGVLLVSKELGAAGDGLPTGRHLSG